MSVLTFIGNASHLSKGMPDSGVEPPNPPMNATNTRRKTPNSEHCEKFKMWSLKYVELECFHFDTRENEKSMQNNGDMIVIVRLVRLFVCFKFKTMEMWLFYWSLIVSSSKGVAHVDVRTRFDCEFQLMAFSVINSIENSFEKIKSSSSSREESHSLTGISGSSTSVDEHNGTDDNDK